MDVSSVTLEMLSEGHKDREEAAESLRTYIFRVVSKRMNDHNSAEDVTQDATFRILKYAIDGGSEPDNMKSYAGRVAINEISRAYTTQNTARRGGRITSVPLEDIKYQLGVDNSESVEIDKDEVLRSAWKTVEEGGHEELLLQCEGLSLIEISKRVGHIVATVKTRLHRSKESLANGILNESIAEYAIN